MGCGGSSIKPEDSPTPAPRPVDFKVEAETATAEPAVATIAQAPAATALVGSAELDAQAKVIVEGTSAEVKAAAEADAARDGRGAAGEPEAEKKGMEVPLARKAVNNDRPGTFRILNDTDNDVRVLWVQFDGQNDTRPERQNDVVASGGGVSCLGGDTGHPFAFVRVDGGGEVACVCFKSEEVQLLSAAIELCAAAPPPLVDCIIEKGAGRDGRVGASVGSTGRVGAARGSGWLVEEVGPLIGLSHV